MDFLLIGLIASLMYCFFLFYRNIKVLKFRLALTDLVFNDFDYMKKLDIQNRVSYEQMLFSFKPLKLESYYSTEEIKILTNND